MFTLNILQNYLVVLYDVSIEDKLKYCVDFIVIKSSYSSMNQKISILQTLKFYELLISLVHI
jgi:hypothetical protein